MAKDWFSPLVSDFGGEFKELPSIRGCLITMADHAFDEIMGEPSQEQRRIIIEHLEGLVGFAEADKIDDFIYEFGLHSWDVAILLGYALCKTQGLLTPEAWLRDALKEAGLEDWRYTNKIAR